MPDRLALERLARETGFRVLTLEKAVRLLALLRELDRHPFLRSRVVLKGGTALNLFCFPLPRLSVDIDLNYIGQLTKEGMEAERPEIVQAVQTLGSGLGYMVEEGPDDYANRRWLLRYMDVYGATGRLKVEVNFLHRLPILPTERRLPHLILGEEATEFSLLALEELSATKIAALLDRVAARDLWDLVTLSRSQGRLDLPLLHRLLIFFGSAGRADFRKRSVSRLDVLADRDIRNDLNPLISANVKLTRDELLREAREFLGPLLDFSVQEREYLDGVAAGRYHPELLFPEASALADRIRDHPAILWKIQNVQAFMEQQARKRRASGGSYIIKRRRR